MLVGLAQRLQHLTNNVHNHRRRDRLRFGDQLREIAAKYPVLGDLPILGSLFRSTQFQKEETELVIIVTPTLVKPLGPGPHSLPTDYFVEPSPLEFYLWGALEGMPPEDRGMPAQFETEGMIGDTGNRITTSFEGGAQ